MSKEICDVCLEEMKSKTIDITERGLVWEYICKICGNKKRINMNGKIINPKGR